MSQNPLRNAILRSCTDPEYRKRLVADPAAALAEEGLEVPPDVRVVVHEPADDTIMVVLPGERSAELVQTVGTHEDGPVTDVPVGLTLTWRGRELVADGRIDGATAPALRREVLKCFGDVWLNLGRVNYLSSAGIAALVAGRKHLSAHDAHLYLSQIPDPVANVLEMVGLADAFDIIEPAAPYGYHDGFGWMQS